MPEGDTVRRLAERLDRTLGDRRLISVEPVSFGRLAGRTVVGVESRGKHLLMRFDSGLALHSHLGMHGSWSLEAGPARGSRQGAGRTAVLEFEEVTAMGRRLRVLEVIRGDARLEHLGPDVLDPEFDVEEAVRRARATEAATAGELLLRQDVLAGIGNIYRCEALWRERVSPWHRVSALSDVELVRLFSSARALMAAAMEPHQGRSRHAVYGRRDRPCPRCGAMVRVSPHGSPPRLVYWCPRCQGETSGGRFEV